MLLEGNPLSDFDSETLVRVKKEFEDGIIQLHQNIKDIEKEFDSRIEFKPLGRITWNGLDKLEKNIRKKYAELLETDRVAFEKKFDEIVAFAVPDPTKVSKKMMDDLADWNHHMMYGAIYDRLPPNQKS